MRSDNVGKSHQHNLLVLMFGREHFVVTVDLCLEITSENRLYTSFSDPLARLGGGGGGG